MAISELTAAGHDALHLATRLLQRVRTVDPVSGLWEAADVQWAWRLPRDSDEAEKLFWVDDHGPVAGVLLTGSPPGRWQCDPVVIPGSSVPRPGEVWHRALELVAGHAASYEVPVADGDQTFIELTKHSGLRAAHRDTTAWLTLTFSPPAAALPPGFGLTDRSTRTDDRHPMSERNGAGVAERLSQCPLYDPALDLAIETADGAVAGYSLFWFDPVTKVGLVEPVRVEDAYQRRGLARAMLSAGIERLAARGARRVKVSYESPAAAALYRGLGFEPESSTTWYQS